MYGNNWIQVQRGIGTRSSTQSRSHAQKVFLNIKNRLKRHRSKNTKKMSYYIDLVRKIINQQLLYDDNADPEISSELAELLTEDNIRRYIYNVYSAMRENKKKLMVFSSEEDQKLRQLDTQIDNLMEVNKQAVKEENGKKCFIIKKVIRATIKSIIIF
jgi:Uri superfamily endonuclease